MPAVNNFGRFDITELGVSVDGSADCSASLQSYIDNLPDTRSNLAGQFPGLASMSYNTGGTHSIVFPSSDQQGNPYRYRFDSPVVVPGNKSIRFTSDAMGGAILENNGPEEYIFQMVGDGGANGLISQFDNLTLWKGGIRYQGRFRGFVETHHMVFIETPGPALRYIDGPDGANLAPIYMDNHHNRYFLCGGSEWIEGRQVGIVGRSWMNRHLWNRDTSVIVDGGDFNVTDSDFQLMDKTIADSVAYLWIRDRDEPTAFVNVARNRFAPEAVDNFPDGVSYGAPRSGVICGDTNDDTNVIANINFHTNRFLGNDPADGTAGLGEYGVEFRHRPFNCSFDMNNYFVNIATAAVGEGWTGGNAISNGFRDRNYWGWNSPAGSLVPTVFENGGESWIQPFIRSVPTTPTNSALYAHDTAGGLHELLEPPAAGGAATWSPVVGPF